MLPSNEMGVVSAADVVGRVEVVVGRNGDGDGNREWDGVLWRQNRYDFWAEEVVEERHGPEEAEGGESEG